MQLQLKTGLQQPNFSRIMFKTKIKGVAKHSKPFIFQIVRKPFECENLKFNLAKLIRKPKRNYNRQSSQ